MFMSKIISLENEISKRIIIDLAVPGYRRDPAVQDNEIDDKALCVIEGIPLCCARGMTVCYGSSFLAPSVIPHAKHCGIC